MRVGNLAITPFYRAIANIVHATGIVEFWALKDQRSYTLYIKKGDLRAIKTERDFASPLEAKAILLDLLMAKEGLYEVRETDFVVPINPSLKWPLEQALISLTIIDEEIKFKTVELASPTIRYQISPAYATAEKASEQTTALERTFLWGQALPYLQEGITGEELASKLRFSEGMVCYYLAKYKNAGMIVRIAQDAPKTDTRLLMAKQVGLPVRQKVKKADNTDIVDVDIVI